MSTKLTSEPVQSLSLDLYHACRAYEDRLGERLSSSLLRDHGITVSPSQLGFLAALVCGENTASDIARKLNISRQAVARQVSDMEKAGHLLTTLDPARRNRSLITFTPAGAELMATCRDALARMDADLRSEADVLRRAVTVLAGP